MKVLITVSSKTGNTRKIAEAIHAAIPEAELYDVENAPDPATYDFIFMGFWVDKGTADEKAQAYMHRIINKKVAVFGTLGAYPDSQHAHDSLEKVAVLLPSCEIIDHFLCQGAIDPKLIEWMCGLPAEHPHAPDDDRRKRWQDASTHPDLNDCQEAASWAIATLNKTIK
jgi:flavodoxin